MGAKLLLETLPKYLVGEIKPEEQNHAQATFTKILTRVDGKIDWHQPAEKIYSDEIKTLRAKGEKENRCCANYVLRTWH